MLGANLALITDSVHFTDAGSVAMAHRVADALISSVVFQGLAADTSKTHTNITD
jgi:hypothetical protein